MPAPKPDLLKQVVRTKFMSFAIKVPANWQQPAGDKGSAYDDAFKPADKNCMPASPPLFQPATMNKVHVDTQKQHVRDYGEFIDETCKAICSAWDQWHQLATMSGVLINAVTASLGMVVGPPLAPLIIAQGLKKTPMLLKYTTAIANAFGTAWLSYTATIKVPGLPWYPAFAAVPSPVAPPAPNTPTPVIALTSVPVTMQMQMLKMSMISNLADPTAPYMEKLFEAFAFGINTVFTTWQTTTMVTNILGTGPVPTFAPPYIPAGPVLAGQGTGLPGCFK
ncbi:MAG TPA: hypothetical protein VGM90_14690 [Kofleriaceae bacterium]|jgi:hypothetical protein